MLYLSRISLLAAAALLCACAHAMQHSSATLKFRRFTMGPDMDFDAAVVEVKFPSPVVVGIPTSSLSPAMQQQLIDELAALKALRNLTLTRLSRLRGADVILHPLHPETLPATLVPHIAAAGGLGALNCTQEGVPHVVFGSDAPLHPVTGLPHGMFLLEPSDAPAPSFGRYLGAPRVDASTLHDDRLAFFLPLNGTWNGTAFANNQGVTKATLQQQTRLCSVVFSPNNTRRTELIDPATNLTLTSHTLPLVPSDNACDSTDHAAMQRAIAYTTSVLHEVGANVIPSVHYANALQAASASLGLFEAFDACHREMQGLYASRNATILVDPTSTAANPEGRINRCPFSPTSPEWTTSPCCSPVAAFTACCDRDDVANVTAFVPILAPGVVLNQTTSSPVLFKALLASHADASKLMRDHADTKPNVDLNTWRQLEGAVADCETKVARQPCRSHGDCRHAPNLCHHGLGLCHVDADHPERAMARCLLETMDDRLRAEWLTNWGIVHSGVSIDVSAAAFAAAILVQTTDYDCTGPTSSLHRQRLNVTFDAFGAATVSIVAANASACVAKTVCNWDPHRVTDAAACNGTATLAKLGTKMCGLKVGGNAHYTDVRREPRCFVPDMAFGHQGAEGTTVFNDGTTCAAFGSGDGTLSIEADGASRCYLAGRRNVTSCYDADRSPLCRPVLDYLVNITAQINRTAPYDPNLVEPLHPFCNRRDPSAPLTPRRSLCFSFAINETTCAAMATDAAGLTALDLGGQMQWNIAKGLRYDHGLAMCYGHFSNASFGLSNAAEYANSFNLTTCQTIAQRLHPARDRTLMNFHLAVQFVPGAFDTQDVCLRGQCKAPAANYSGVDAGRCAAATQCSHSCGKCVASLSTPLSNVMPTFCAGPYHDGGPCNGTVVILNSTLSLCRYPYDEHLCKWVGYTHHTCADVTDPEVCTLSGIRNTSSVATLVAHHLGCYWSDNEPCETRSECTNPAVSSKCTDYDAALCTCNSVNGCTCEEGACIEPWRIDSKTGLRHTCLLGAPGIQQLSIGCKNATANTASACGALGGYWEWHVRGRTSETCLGYGKSCPSSENSGVGNYLARPETACLTCGAPAVVPKFDFAPAVASSGQLLPLEWIDRGMVPENAYKRVMSFAKLRAIAWRFALRVIAAEMQRTVGLIHSHPAALIAAYVAHKNGSDVTAIDPRIGYDPATGLITPMRSCTVPMHASVPQTCSSGTASLTFAPGAIKRPGGLLIQMTTVDHGLLLANRSSLLGPGGTSQASPPVGLGGIILMAFPGGESAAKKSTDSVSATDFSTPSEATAQGYLIPGVNYGLVVDEDGDAVGSIIGNVAFSQLNNDTDTEFVLEIAISQSIQPNLDEYPIYDFAVATPYLGMVPTYTEDIQMNGLVLRGTVNAAVCVATQSGSSKACTFAPIIRKKTTSKLSALVIALIVLASVLAATLIVGALYVKFCRVPPRAYSPVKP